MRGFWLGRRTVAAVVGCAAVAGVLGVLSASAAATQPPPQPPTFASEPPTFTSDAVTLTSTYLYFPGVDRTISGGTFVPVDEATFTMARGEIRRVTDQLEIRAKPTSSGYAPEVDNRLECFDQQGSEIYPPGAGSDLDAGLAGAGTNYISQDDVPYQWNASMLIQAPQTTNPEENYFCLLLVEVDSGYEMTAMAPTTGETTYGTWLEVTADTDADAKQAHTGVCSTAGTETPPPGTKTPPPESSSYCVYVGGPALLGNSAAAYVPWEVPGGTGPQGTGDVWDWTATDDATTIDGIATLQISDCYGPSDYIPIYGFLHVGTPNCIPSEWGASGVSNADGESYMDIDQLYPNGSVCQVNRAYSEETTPDGQVLLNEGFLSEDFTVLKAQEHLPLYYHVSAPVSQTCDGSRTFAVDVYIEGTGGNAVVINGGNVNVLNSVRATTTTVPDVVGLTEAQADDAIQGTGLTAVPESLSATAPSGTVLDQNSPGGTIEPTGSPVDITVSAGRVTIQ
jgi:hypothetical protein